jgi:hypothetical protein
MKYMNIRKLGHDKWELLFFTVLSVTTFLMISSVSTAYAGPAEREQAKRIHDRLTGVPPTDADLSAMEILIVNGNPQEAARYAMDPNRNSRAKYFYNVTLKNWITPWTNEDQTMFAPLNDYTATVIGMIRDDVPFDQVLYGDYVYVGNGTNVGISLPPYSHSNNDHYEALEDNGIDLSNPAYLEQRMQSEFGMAGSSAAKSAGVITTRAAGKAFFKAGTNRAMLRFTFMNYLCRDLEDVKDITRIPDGIRQDVSRSPGGDSSIFLNSCIGCHAGMDPLAGAYAYFEWTEDENGENGQVIYTDGVVQPKYHINRTNFEFGYITRDDHWKNYWREGPNEDLGWGWKDGDPVAGSETQVEPGEGPKSLGRELSASEAFAQCQVEKVYKHVCLQNPIEAHTPNIIAITDNFRSSNYNMKEVFAEVAALCSGN